MSKVRIFALGGLDEDGKNMLVVEVDEKIFVIEAGLKYPDSETLGVEFIIPDFSYLIQNKDRVKAIFITHAHDDVVKRIRSIPVFALSRSSAANPPAMPRSLP